MADTEDFAEHGFPASVWTPEEMRQVTTRYLQEFFAMNYGANFDHLGNPVYPANN